MLCCSRPQSGGGDSVITHRDIELSERGSSAAQGSMDEETGNDWTPEIPFENVSN